MNYPIALLHNGLCIYFKLRCLVSPFYTQGKIRWGTKMGLTSVTDEIERFVAECELDYVGFRYLLECYSHLD